jgi:hypothetical protein
MDFKNLYKSLPEGGYTHGYIPRPVAVVCVKENPFTVAHHTPVNKDPFIYAISVEYPLVWTNIPFNNIYPYLEFGTITQNLFKI